jgi:tetratricopeptide (TPR) repeat protein
MHVALAFLAEHAVAHDDGKFYALGGGIDRMEFQSFPAEPAALALLVKVRLTRDEGDKVHTLEVAGIGPDGKSFLPVVGFTVRPTQTPRQTIFQFAHTLRDLRFEGPGLHRFSIRVDSLEVASVDLDIVKAEGPLEPASAGDTLSTTMSRGYAAFGRGQVEEARAIFEAAVREFPESAEAHNNLGFVRLVQRQPTEALESFLQAEKIGFTIPQILKANIGCCYFLVGDAKRALNLFKELMTSTFPAAGSVLVGLGRLGYLVIALGSPSDFVSLMALNAARCALAIGEIDEAETFADVSQVGEYSSNETTRARFATLRAELLEDVSAYHRSTSP